MSFASALPVADPAVAGESVPVGQRMMGMAQRIMRAGMAMARGVNRIARHRLAGEDLSRLAPPGFNPTFANALIVQAVGWTAALRERLRAVVVPPEFVTEPPQAERGPRARGAAFRLPEGTWEPAEDDWHDWRELARPLRIGPSGVAVAARAIAGLSDQQVVTQICGNLSRAAAELGAEADVARIAALEAAAKALCIEADVSAEEAPEEIIEDAVADAGEAEPGASGGWASPSRETGPAAGTEHEPPLPPPPD
jgi:hypothetical protein